MHKTTQTPLSYRTCQRGGPCFRKEPHFSMPIKSFQNEETTFQTFNRTILTATKPSNQGWLLSQHAIAARNQNYAAPPICM
jgi:hypothetical protein